VPESPISPTRTEHVLKGVPKIGFYTGGPRCPEDLTFPAVLRALAEYLGEDVGCYEVRTRSADPRFGCTYAYFLGTSGAAFQLGCSDHWDMSQNDPRRMAADPLAAFDHAFEAFGRSYAYLPVADPANGAAQLRQRIVASLDQGLPVISFGVVGPPEAGLITGYEEGGEVLLGWNFFQSDPNFAAGLTYDDNGYFRKRGWYADAEAVIIIGEKISRPEYPRLFRKSLEWAVELLTTPAVLVNGGAQASGIAAYDVWMENLGRDREFATLDDRGLFWRFLVHDSLVGQVAEARWYGSVYLSRLANLAPGNLIRAEALRAAACLTEQHDLMWQVWDAVGGIGIDPSKSATFARPEVRRSMLPILQQARALEEQVAVHLAQALSGTSRG
jgi:hypothetical protein